jgi:hypothetical protein
MTIRTLNEYPLFVFFFLAFDIFCGFFFSFLLLFFWMVLKVLACYASFFYILFLFTFVLFLALIIVMSIKYNITSHNLYFLFFDISCVNNKKLKEYTQDFFLKKKTQ